jgi:hypothetical protein
LIIGKSLDFAAGVEVDCLALSLVEMFGSLWQNMLFVKVPEDK